MSSIINFIINSIRKFGLNHIITENSNNIIIEVSGKRSNLVNFYYYIRNKISFPIRIILCKYSLRIEIPKWYFTKTLASKVRSVTKQNSLACLIKIVRTIPKFKSIILLISKFIVDYDLDNETEYFKIDLKGLNEYITSNTTDNISVKDIIFYLRELSNLEKVKKVRYRYNSKFLEVLFIS